MFFLWVDLLPTHPRTDVVPTTNYIYDINIVKRLSVLFPNHITNHRAIRLRKRFLLFTPWRNPKRAPAAARLQTACGRRRRGRTWSAMAKPEDHPRFHDFHGLGET